MTYFIFLFSKKPDNVGFDEDGHVKIFDFGLAKDVSREDKTVNNSYNLTGNTGSLRYMAPEVARCLPYDYRVDAYSFGILFWQVCSLTTPYSGYTCKMHAELIVGKGDRPKFDHTWPLSWKNLMSTCWDANISSRPDFDHIVKVLDTELSVLLNQADVGTAGVRAKAKKAKVLKAGQRLDVDTRLGVEGESDGVVRRHDKVLD